MSVAAALAAWGRADVLGRLAGGIRNEVLLVDVDGRSRVARVGRRATDDLEWELDLLTALNAAGIPVPTIVPALDGRRHVAGLVVMEFVDGRPPGSTREWRAVADYLRRVHALGVGWPQRPGWASSLDLLTGERSPVVDLGAMPAESVQRCRGAWRRLAGTDLTVVHGDPNDRNVRITDEGVLLLDWDEARVDVPALDIAAVPGLASPLRGRDRWAAEQALHAWEAAACWTAEPLYAQRRLDQVEFVRPGPRRDRAGHRSPRPAMGSPGAAPTATNALPLTRGGRRSMIRSDLKSLGLVAAEHSQEVEGGPVFHAPGHHPQAEGGSARPWKNDRHRPLGAQVEQTHLTAEEGAAVHDKRGGNVLGG